jgi:hypothetical protein
MLAQKTVLGYKSTHPVPGMGISTARVRRDGAMPGE